MRRVFVLTVGMVVMFALAVPASAGSTRQTADVIENQSGGGEIVAADLTRTNNGISIRVRLETPEPGDYNYPDSVPLARQVAPEVFTGWAFVFANPDECSDDCGGDDLGNPAVGASIYNIAGHVTGGGYLTLSGHISVGQENGLVGPGATPVPLSNPEGLEVHVAIAPHGKLDPSTMPGELRSPVGGPTCDCWWVAVFLPPA